MYPALRRIPFLALLAFAALAVAVAPGAAAKRRVPAARTVHAHAVHAHARRSHARRHHRLRRVLSAHPSRDRARKRAAQRRYRRKLGHSRGRAPRTSFRATVFSGINAAGISDQFVSPSDSTGAIGPAQYVEFTNGRITVYDRSTMASVATSTIESFVGAPSDDVGDPQIQWDPQSSRWYYLTYDDNGSSTFHLAFGWSKTASPTPLGSAGWCNYTIPTGTLFPDFPKLGHDDKHLIFGVNAFDLSDPNHELLSTAQIYALAKPANGVTTCPSTPAATGFGSSASPLKTTNGRDVFTPVPANATDPLAAGYVVAADGPDALMAWHVGDSSGTPTLVEDGDMPVSSYSLPGPAVQQGTSNELDTLDAQLTNAVARTDPSTGKEAVWTQHTVDSPSGRSVVRWYEVTPSDLTVRQAGTISDPSSFLFNASISPAGNGRDAVVQYNASGPSQLPSIRASAHRATGPPGSVGFPATIVTSALAFDDDTCGGFFNPCRWGDYSGSSPDPSNEDVVWGTSQYSGGGGWLTRNFAVQVQPGGPTAAITASPATVDANQPVTFSGSGSTDDEAALIHYLWDLDGNGSFETDTGSSPTASRSYPLAGTVTPRLRVVDANGDRSEAATAITVNAVPPPPKPTAACLKARRKRDKLARAVKSLRKRVARAHTLRKRKAYSRRLTKARSQLRKARTAATKACA